MVSITNLPEWIAENEENFQPPVCNRMLRNKQLKVFLVGGPNERLDFHLEEGEEFFYQLKGDMVLRIRLDGQFQDVTIREGEGFLLPARVAHSPQRFKDTIGLVIERQRAPHEFDCLRWYTSSDNSSNGQVLFERWFHCSDLTQLKPVIQEFVTSSEFLLRKPGPGSFLRKPVFEEASNIIIHPPISLVEEVKFLLHKKSSSSSSSTNSHNNSNSNGYSSNNSTTGAGALFRGSQGSGPLCRSLFRDLKCTSSVTLYGPGEHAIEHPKKSGCDLFLLQLSGSCTWILEGEGPPVSGCLKCSDCITVPICEKSRSITLTNGEGATSLAVSMPPA